MGPVTEQAQPDCHLLSIPSYLVCAKDWAALWAMAKDQSLKPHCSKAFPKMAPSSLCPHCPGPWKGLCQSSLLPHLTTRFWLLRNLLAQMIPLHLLQPCQKVFVLQPLLPSRVSAQGAVVRVAASTGSCFVILYFTMFVSSQSIQPSLHPSIIHFLF